MCITYEVDSGLYVNMTNRCSNACTFCIRNNGDGAYGSDSLWLEREPTVDEVKASVFSRDLSKYTELVFCGYGEPTYRLVDARSVALAVKERAPHLRVRINTNGHSDLILGEDSAPLYKDAFDEAFALEDSNKITVDESYREESWKEGYKDSFGVRYEEVTSYPANEGVFEAILDTGMTKNIIVGHNHTSNFSIKYKGVRLTFALKTGRGSYYSEELNGGTVIRVGEDGVYRVEHAYVKQNVAKL